MNQDKKKQRDEVISANIYVHSSIAELYNTDSHWRKENIAHVRSVLENLCREQKISSSQSRLLDVGCGSGFVINLTKDLFKRIDGVDVTKAMLDKIDISNGNIFLKEGIAEDTGFDANTFDMATAYSVLDHLFDVKDVYKEVCRVLKPGGVFYADLVPNKPFWDMIVKLDPKKKYSAIVEREVRVLESGDRISNELALDPEKMAKAEPGKSKKNGFMASDIEEQCLEAGFSKVVVKPFWFIGQGEYINNPAYKGLAEVADYLEKANPVSSVLFKYLKIFAYK